MQNWQYMTLSVYLDKKKWVCEYGGKKYDESERNRIMNELGKQGWELVTTTSFINSSGTIEVSFTYTEQYTLFFKRPSS